MIIFIRNYPPNASWGSNQKLPDCIVLAGANSCYADRRLSGRRPVILGQAPKATFGENRNVFEMFSRYSC